VFAVKVNPANTNGSEARRPFWSNKGVLPRVRYDWPEGERRPPRMSYTGREEVKRAMAALVPAVDPRMDHEPMLPP
jgi:hypothetical protein